MAQITYADKSTMNENASIPATNKVQASDMNEIKNVVNQNWNVIGDYVIETGGDWNTNYYEKWESGKLVQWGESKFTSAITTTNGALYRPSSDITKTLVEPFIDSNYSLQLTGVGGYVSVAYMSERYTDKFTYYPLSTWSVNNSNNKYIHWIAIGRWK